MLDSGNSPIADLATAVGEFSTTPAYLRATLTVEDDGSSLVRYFEAVVGKEPPHWQSAHWRYQTVEFVAQEVRAGELVRWLRDGGTSPLRNARAAGPTLHDNSNWNDRPSQYKYGSPPLPWPSREWSFNLLDPSGSNNQWHPRDVLVSADAPTFALFQVAHRAFYRGNFTNYGADQVPHDFGRLWHLQTDAWLHEVRYGQAFVQLTVRGDHFAGTRIDVVGEAGHFQRTVTKSGRMRVHLPDGAASDSWLYLVGENRCYDYRILGSRHVAQEELARQGVIFDLPDDPEVDAASSIGQIETVWLENKRQVPDTKDQVQKVMRTVAAFATGEGGDIVFGVDDDLTTVGVPADNLQSERDRLFQIVRDHVVPPPEVDVEIVAYDDLKFLILHVPSGPEALYALNSKPPKYFVRRGTHTVPARPEELRSAVEERQPTPKAEMRTLAQQYGLA